MWYLLFCEKDNSFSKVTETSVMNVGGSLEIDDIVTFFYSNASHLGKIVSMDENEEAIDKELKRLGKKARRVTRKSSAPPAETETLPPKRVTKPTSKFSPTSSSDSTTNTSTAASTRKKRNNAKAVAAKSAGARSTDEETAKILNAPKSVAVPDDLLQSDPGSDDEPVTKKTRNWVKSVKDKQNKAFESESDESRSQSPLQKAQSPSKDDLLQQIRILQEKLNSSETDNKNDNDSHEVEGAESLHPSQVTPVASNQKTSSSATVPAVKKSESGNDVSDDEVLEDISIDLPADNTLFGKDYEQEEMVKLVNNTYCRKSVLCSALSNSLKQSHLVGKLIPGVFTKEAIMKATLTGKRPPAAGRANAPEDLTGLHPTAIKDILLYAAEVRKRRSWAEQTPDILNRRMTQKVGELKRKWKEEDEKQKAKPVVVPVDNGGGAGGVVEDAEVVAPVGTA